MRKQVLRQTANRFLKTDNLGSYKDRQHRAFVIHRLIDDLFVLGDVPGSWSALKIHHIQNLIQHWQKHKVKAATIIDYMTTIRGFLHSIECPLENIDNKALGLSRQYKTKKTQSVQPDIWTQLTEPVAQFIMAMQAQFGLTFNEAINITPDIHIKDHSLWITREIAFNSADRTIPIRHETQRHIIKDLIQYTQGNQKLAALHHYEAIRSLWCMGLNSHKLPTNKTYRYLYAQQLKKELLPILGNYQTNWIIRDEMGIKSANTLWLYFNE